MGLGLVPIVPKEDPKVGCWGAMGIRWCPMGPRWHKSQRTFKYDYVENFERIFLTEHNSFEVGKLIYDLIESGQLGNNAHIDL